METTRIEWGHFIRDLEPDKAAALFKSSVQVMAFSISSYCNRQCSYCPNSIADRKSKRNYMSDGLFFNILRQLSRIDYSEEVNITRYNEPLADKDYALSRLRDIRVLLPRARIHIFTNGDYLDRAYLDDLVRVGVTSVEATVHSGPGGKTDVQSLMLEQTRRLEELDLSFTFEDASTTEKYRIARATLGPLHLSYAAHDFYRGAETGEAWAFDRGGSLPIPKTYVREKPCFAQFSEMSVEWDGTLLPCCQIQNDVFDHDRYVLGKLDADSDMFVAWTNVHYANWRAKMFNYKRKGAPCATCTYGMATDLQGLRNAVAGFQEAMRNIEARKSETAGAEAATAG